MSLLSSGVFLYDKLQKVLGVSRLNLWSSPSCGPSILPSSATPSPHYSWGVVLYCWMCHSHWLVRSQCSNVRSCFRNAGDCLSHHHRKHQSDIKKANTASPNILHSLSPKLVSNCQKSVNFCHDHGHSFDSSAFPVPASP
jgi:hypothetical protein